VGRRLFPWLPSAGARRRLFFGLRKPARAVATVESAAVEPAPADVKEAASA
jgi:hypothetical protein